jgi:hypothetical protein
MTEIYIEGNKCDVNVGFSSLLTLALDDLKDFGSRNTSFSKTIVLPGTARNNKVFGQTFDVRSANPYSETLPNVNINFNAAKRAKCVIFQDSVQSFKGSIRLIEIVIDQGVIEYEVAVFGELYGLIAAMGSNRLQDLDFSAYDHTYNYANINASWDDYNAGAGYYYPLIDYGGYSIDKANWDALTFRPALFVKEYLEKIFTAAGYTYTFPLIDTERFKRLIIPYNRKVLTSSTSLAAQATKTAFQALENGVIDSLLVDFDMVSSGLFSYSSGTFTYASITQSLTFNVIINLVAISDVDTIFSIYKNGSPLAGTERTIPASPGGQVVQFNFSFDESFASGNTWYLFFDSPTGGNYNVFVDLATISVTTLAAQFVPLSIGDTVIMNDTIPANILQKDFVSSIMKLFNLYIYEDPEKETHVNIAPYVDYYTNTERVDWTQKVDRASPIRITPMANLTARFYDFKMKADSDYYNDLYQKRYNENYGQYIYDSAFDFEEQRQTVELIFSATPLVGYSGEDKIYSSIMKIENAIETQTDSNIRILQGLKVTGVTAWNITGQASGLTVYPYAGHYDDPDAPSNDINYGVPNELFFTLTNGAVNVNQFNVYWSSYMAEISDKDSKLMRCKMRLTIADIATLDFSRLIWVDGALWRLVKITDYNLSEPDLCSVELLKTIEIIY